MKNPSLVAFNSHGKPLNLYRPVYFGASFPREMGYPRSTRARVGKPWLTLVV